jgi:hypothetical protein
MITCPDCGSELTVKTNKDLCPSSMRSDGLHPIFIVKLGSAMTPPLNRITGCVENLGDCGHGTTSVETHNETQKR